MKKTDKIDEAWTAFKVAIKPHDAAYDAAVKPHDAAYDAAMESLWGAYNARLAEIEKEDEEP
jgi:hypothetical protein